MSELVDVVKTIAEAMVDNPDQVEVSEIKGSNSRVLELKVAKSDLGMVIGKKGRNAQAIRTVLNAVSAKTRQRVTLEILE